MTDAEKRRIQKRETERAFAQHQGPACAAWQRQQESERDRQAAEKVWRAQHGVGAGPRHG